MSRLTAVVLSLLALSCSALKVPFAGRKVDARVTSPFVDFVGPNVDDAAESLRAEFEVLKTEVVTEPQPETVEIFDPFLGETYLKTKPAPVTPIPTMPTPMRRLSRVQKRLAQTTPPCARTSRTLQNP